MKDFLRAYPGVEGTSYTIHIRAHEWADLMACSEMLDTIIPILFHSTTEDERVMIFSLDIYNMKGTMNCHHEFQEIAALC